MALDVHYVVYCGNCRCEFTIIINKCDTTWSVRGESDLCCYMLSAKEE